MMKSHQKRGPISKEARAAARENTIIPDRYAVIPLKKGISKTNVSARRAAAPPAKAALTPTRERVNQVVGRFGEVDAIFYSFCIIPGELPYLKLSFISSTR